MPLWLVRAGVHGEYEKKFLDERRIYLTWDGLSYDLDSLETRDELRTLLENVYPDASKGRINNHVGQIWAFSKGINVGDCQVSRNDAEQRIFEMAGNDWKATASVPIVSKKSDDSHKPDDEHAEMTEGLEDLAQAARDQLAKLMIARFKGHGMARLVDAVLRAQGYTTYLSPEGPDKGIDILAAPEPMGFGKPRVCVQVKSGDFALDRPTLDQLIGVMQNVQATHGLLVSWGGFKSTIDKEEATQFFRVRLWDQGDLIDQVLAQYDKLDEEMRAELPLKRIWVVTEAAE